MDLDLLQIFVLSDFGLLAAVPTALVAKRMFELGIFRRVGALIPNSTRPTPWLCGREMSPTGRKAQIESENKKNRIGKNQPYAPFNRNGLHISGSFFFLFLRKKRHVFCEISRRLNRNSSLQKLRLILRPSVLRVPRVVYDLMSDMVRWLPWGGGTRTNKTRFYKRRPACTY